MKKINAAYIYLLPTIFFVVFVFLFPIIKIFQYAFTNNNSDNLFNFSLNNFKILFNDPVFFTALRNNLTFFIAIPILLIISISVAILLFEKIKGWKIYRSIIFLPWILSIVVVGTFFSIILAKYGPLNIFLEKIGLSKIAIDWLGNPKIALYTLLFIIIWKMFGFGVLIFNARLLSIDIEILEAAEIDGANWFQKHIHVTIYELRGLIEFYSIQILINMLAWVFAYVFVITYGGPGTSTVVMEYYIYFQLFSYNHLDIASAATIFILIISFILIFLQLRFAIAFKEQRNIF